MRDEPLVLGIETSCDETGDRHRARRRRCSPTPSRARVDEHARFGGVVPEVASRAHLEAMVPTIERALRDGGRPARRRRRRRRHRRARARRRADGRRRRGEGARRRARQAAVRRQPPRRPRRRRPAGARPAARADDGAAGLRRPLVAAARARRHRRRASRSARTIDDAAGEAFDKVARLLGLPFPGGPCDRPRGARRATAAAIAFPRGLSAPHDLARHRYDFSFSGLKTAVARWVERRRGDGRAGAGGRRRGELPGGRRRRAHPQGGRGVPRARRRGTCSRRRGRGRTRGCARWPQERCDAAGIVLRVPRPGLCTDNGAMVAALGAQLVAARPPGRRRLGPARRLGAAR